MIGIKNSPKYVSSLNNIPRNIPRNTPKENRKITSSKSVPPGLGAMLGAVLIALGLLLAACPATSNSESGDGTGDGNGGGTTTPYVCQNGTPADGDATADNITKCTDCNNGFKLVNEQCVDTEYTCDHGTPTDGKPQGNVDEAKCASCNAGYFMPQGTSVCTQEGVYFCENGTARTGNTGSTNTVHECVRCFQGYAKRANNQCTRAVYTCSGGTPTSGNPAAGNQDVESCQSCSAGYKPDGSRCTRAIFTCSGGTPATGNPIAGNQDVESCQSCSAGYKPDGSRCTRAIFTCTGGTPATGNPIAGNQDVESCQRCSSGYLLSGVLCSNDVDNDGILNTADSCPTGQSGWTSNSTTDSDSDGCRDTAEDVDDNNNGLIEISTLTMLHNMRYNLAGTGYDDEDSDDAAMHGKDATGDNRGGPTSPTTDCTTATSGVYLCGYELTQNLTFDTANNGTFTVSSGYTLDSTDHNATYFPVALDGSGGWLPIGDNTHPFVAIFEGNSHTITGLAIKRNQTYIGMFGYIDTGAHIRNVGLVDNLADYSNSSNSTIYIGGLVGRKDDGYITASYTTGSVDGGNGNNDRIGGLVGYQADGYITASYATGSTDGGNGNNDRIGGLVGYQADGYITASYATGSIEGRNGENDSIGGLVGYQTGGFIAASYATGSTDGGGGGGDHTGGLVGYQTGGSITASYAAGNTNGGGGDSDYTGGLVGWQQGGSITASYATGSANGGGGDFDYTGGLVGAQSGGTITASYATGNTNGGGGGDDYTDKLAGIQSNGSITASYGFGTEVVTEYNGIDATTLPYGVTTAAALTATNVAGCVGIANEKAYTSQTTCEATSIVANVCAWSGSACSDGSNVVDGITCSAFTTQSTCPVSAISNKPAGTWNGNVWNAAASGTAGAWDFGTNSQAPALKYSNYDINGVMYDCNQFPVTVTCGTTLLPGQRD